MNKTIVIAGIVILALVGGGWYMVNQQSQQIKEVKRDEEKAVMMDENSASRYVEYSKTVLDQAVNNRRVLYFYASWCPTCIPADADFKANTSKFPDDLIVVRVNYNDLETDKEEKDLAEKHGITYQHTFVQIDSQGKEVTKWNGGQTDELLANIK